MRQRLRGGGVPELDDDECSFAHAAVVVWHCFVIRSHAPLSFRNLECALEVCGTLKSN